MVSGFLANAQTVTQVFGSGAYSFSMEFVTISNPNNLADTAGTPNPAGSVPYIYNLGKYEVSRDMVLKASTAGGLGLTLADMTDRGGNGADKPAAGISWNQAARFVNWLNASKGFAPAYNFSTSGANDHISVWATGQHIDNNRFRHKAAYYFLPTIDEWYKGAYFDPNKNGGLGGYWLYPTRSNDAPAYSSGGTVANTAIYGGQIGPADIYNAGGLSAYGTMGQGGNVWEWMETANDLFNDVPDELRTFRGGAFDNINTDTYQQAIFNSFGHQPNDQNLINGFRVAMIPEPSSLSLLLAGGVVLMASRCRRD